MKDYFGSVQCPYCNKKFNWKYTDDGYRPWMKKWGRIVTITSYVEDKNISLCRHIIDDKTNTHYFISQCTHCRAAVSFPCSEDIAKELSS
ncbi:MAG: hypothetical protein IJ322_03885 [Clostridia bacterium]|nr:hypothetical protein [Clostridia bacterium]